MAIYSLHHSVVGKTTQRKIHTASAHIRYVARRKACSRLLGMRMPTSSAKAQSWFREQEDADRKNARICDKVLLALPRELTSSQQADLVRTFAELVTEGRASWLAAFHVTGKDVHNPHCHLVIRDRDPETGKRVCKLSEKGSTQWLRLMWEERANLALDHAGREERIDRRTLQAQGIKRRPTIHEGLSAREMQAEGRPVTSRTRRVRNGAGAQARERVVDYRKVDKGRTRPGYNQFIRETEADYWAAIDADSIAHQWERNDSASALRITERAENMQKPQQELAREREAFLRRCREANELSRTMDRSSFG